MRITAIEAIPIRVPIDPTSQVTAFGPRHFAEMVLVRIETEDGIIGYGEALARHSLRSYVSIIEDLLVPRLIGRNPFHVEGLWQEMFRTLTGKAGGMLLEAVAACDIALWDIMGKACGQPLHHLLGSCGRDRIEAYASSISWASDEIAAAQVDQALEAGFRAIKVKVGAPIGRALERAALVRRIAGEGIELYADGNWAFDRDDALRLGRGLAELGYAWLEEPIIPEDVEGYVQLRRALPLRLAAGESEHTVYGCRALLMADGVGIIQPDPARAGGITETRRIGMLAYACGVPFAPHIGFCGAVCAAASLHLSASLPNFTTYEAMIFDNPLRTGLATPDLTDPKLLVDGALPIPTAPGLGIEIELGFVERFRADS